MSVSKSSNAHQIIDAIILALFAHETRRHQLCIDNLAQRNSHNGPILHRNMTFRPSWAISGGRRGSLDTVLWPDMERFLMDKDAIDWDSKTIWQLLFSMVVDCTSLQDVRDALPDFVVEMIPGLKEIPRDQPEAWTIQNDKRILRQYEKIREKMELYSKMSQNPGIAKMMSYYNFEAE